MANPTAETDRTGNDLLRRWDSQQQVYVREREAAYDLMLSLLEVMRGPQVHVLDLAAGPGSISERLLARQPRATLVALDADPVLQAVGRRVLGDFGGRLRWVRADLREHDWAGVLAHEPEFGAVLTSTALHWLDRSALTRVYRDLAALLPAGGVFMNFDGFNLEEPDSSVGRAVKELDQRRQREAIADGAEAWQDWWDAAREDPTLREEFERRTSVFGAPSGRLFNGAERAGGTTVDVHRQELLAAGFAHADCVWQDLHKRILVAVR